MQTGRKAKSKCTSPELGKQLYLEVREKAPHQEHIPLSKELKEHSEACPHCSELLPFWMISAGGGLTAAAENVLAEAKQQHSGVLHIRRGNLNIYFRRQAPDSTDGLLVSAREDGSLVSVDKTTIDEFHSL